MKVVESCKYVHPHNTIEVVPKLRCHLLESLSRFINLTLIKNIIFWRNLNESNFWAHSQMLNIRSDYTLDIIECCLLFQTMVMNILQSQTMLYFITAAAICSIIAGVRVVGVAGLLLPWWRHYITYTSIIRTMRFSLSLSLSHTHIIQQ